MIYNKAFENVFVVEDGVVKDVDLHLLEENTSNEYVVWLRDYIEDFEYVVKGVFATQEFLVLILTNSLKDTFHICRLSLTGNYRGQFEVDTVLIPELEMINHIIAVTI